MDRKSEELICNIHERILSSHFDEIDIYSLLILLREYSILNKDYSITDWEHGYLHEICDFVAHRNRNKGFVLEEAKYIYKQCTTTGEFHFDTESKRRVVAGFSEDAIIHEINSIFEKLELCPIPKESENEIILCIISILQLSVFKSADGEVHGYLYVEICNDGIYLLNDIFDAGLSQILLRVEDERYIDVVKTPLALKSSCFRLIRNGKRLDIVLPELDC